MLSPEMMEGRDCFPMLWRLALALMAIAVASAWDVTYDGRSLIIDGQHKILFSGSIHYPRSTPEVWNGDFLFFICFFVWSSLVMFL